VAATTKEELTETLLAELSDLGGGSSSYVNVCKADVCGPRHKLLTNGRCQACRTGERAQGDGRTCGPDTCSNGYVADDGTC
jgi:hypothetical protein